MDYLLVNQTQEKDIGNANFNAQLDDSPVSSSNIKLWHKRLGHVSSSTLNKILPTKYYDIVDALKKCNACPCAK